MLRPDVKTIQGVTEKRQSSMRRSFMTMSFGHTILTLCLDNANTGEV